MHLLSYQLGVFLLIISQSSIIISRKKVLEQVKDAFIFPKPAPNWERGNHNRGLQKAKK
jgi:hypothetical protein